MRIPAGMFVCGNRDEFFHQGSANSDATPDNLNQLRMNPADVVADLAYEDFLGLMPNIPPSV